MTTTKSAKSSKTSKSSVTFDTKTLTKELKIDARALGIPAGAAEVFIQKSLKAAKKSLSNKSSITHQDLTRVVAQELKKYHADLAYVYQNRDTII